MVALSLRRWARGGISNKFLPPHEPSSSFFKLLNSFFISFHDEPFFGKLLLLPPRAMRNFLEEWNLWELAPTSIFLLCSRLEKWSNKWRCCIIIRKADYARFFLASLCDGKNQNWQFSLVIFQAILSSEKLPFLIFISKAFLSFFDNRIW